jgi:hypothetical protein
MRKALILVPERCVLSKSPPYLCLDDLALCLLYSKSKDMGVSFQKQHRLIF